MLGIAKTYLAYTLIRSKNVNNLLKIKNVNNVGREPYIVVTEGVKDIELKYIDRCFSAY